MEMAIGWRVELWKLGMARKTHVDFTPDAFTSAMQYAEIANTRHGFAHVAVSPIHAPDRIREPINTDCAHDCPVCYA